MIVVRGDEIGENDDAGKEFIEVVKSVVDDDDDVENKVGDVEDRDGESIGIGDKIAVLSIRIV